MHLRETRNLPQWSWIVHTIANTGVISLTEDRMVSFTRKRVVTKHRVDKKKWNSSLKWDEKLRID